MTGLSPGVSMLDGSLRWTASL